MGEFASFAATTHAPPNHAPMTSLRRFAPACRTAAVLAAALAAPAAAQRASEMGVSVGTAIPLGAAAEARGPGVHLAGTFDTGASGAFSLRIDGFYETFSRRRTLGGLSSLGIRASAVATVWSGTPSAYLMVGGGGYLLSAGAAPERSAVGVHAGAGVRIPAGRVAVALEATPVLLLTDYGTESDFQALSYVPVSLGVRIPR